MGDSAWGRDGDGEDAIVPARGRGRLLLDGEGVDPPARSPPPVNGRPCTRSPSEMRVDARARPTRTVSSDAREVGTESD